jgi:hypothetical protein
MSLGIRVFSTQVRGDFAELFEGGFEVLDDFLAENIGIRMVVGFPKALLARRCRGWLCRG